MQYKPTIPSVCEWCEFPFLGFRSSQGRFCSTACSNRAHVPPLAERLASRVNQAGPLPEQHPEFGCCWIKLTSDPSGYARVYRVDGRPYRPAHQIAWEIASGQSIPPGNIVLHTCDIRNCVRNDVAGLYVVGDRELLRYGHLALGTLKDNSLDASIKGNSSRGAYRRAATKPETWLRGEANGKAVLTNDQAREIRQRYGAGGVTGSQLAQCYGVGESTIYGVLSGHTYKDLAGLQT